MERLTLNAGLRWEPYFGTNFDNGAISNFVLDNFRGGVKSTVYVNAPAGLIYPGRPRVPRRQDGVEQAVAEFLAAPGRRMGRERRRPNRGALLVRDQLRVSGSRVPAGGGAGGPVQQPRRPEWKPAVRGSVSRGPRRAAAPGAESDPQRRGVPRVRVVLGDRSRHQLDARPVVERHRRAAGRRIHAGVGQLPGQLSRSPVGQRPAEPGRLPGPRPMHAAGRVRIRPARPRRTSSSGVR